MSLLREKIEKIIKGSKTTDAGWAGSGWTKLDDFCGEKGACSLWLDNKYPTRFAIKAAFFAERNPDPKSLDGVREFMCVGKEHALEIYERTVRAMSEEVAYA